MIKVSDLAYCRLRVPDLARSERFLLDFGLIPVARTGTALYFRGTDPVHHCYILEQGETHFLGFAFSANTEEDLRLFADRTGRAVRAIDGPGGGQYVRLREPNGYEIDVVFGIEKADPIEVKRQFINTGAQPLLRAGELLRLPTGRPTPIKRLAHVVLGSPRVAETAQWFRETLGLIASDEVYVESGQKLLGTFMRLDRGAEYVDHHAFFVVNAAFAGLGHISFEAQDMDAVLADHHYLKGLGRHVHLWGIGRHFLGSQMFDYWADPYGYAHEHWADSDRLAADAPTGIWDAKDAMITQWGDPAPERFRTALRP